MPPVKAQVLTNVCVMVVDDMPDELRMLARFLGDVGARVVTAVDGTEALRLAPLIRPDLVVLDVNLPPPDGLAVCRALHGLVETPDLPVIFVSGLLDISTRLQGFAAGGRDFMTKPFTAEELVARVLMHSNLGRRLRARLPDPGLPRWLSSALQRLQTSLGAPPELEALALEVGTTVHRLHEGFRIHLQTTPAAFVREARLRQAAQQLRDTAVPVAEIGAALGYPNPANFATAFRERFGAAPNQYRQRQVK